MGKAKLAVIHPTALVSNRAKIGSGSRIWAFAQVREGAMIGRSCMIGNGAYIDAGVRIGNRCDVHNKALLYRNLIIEDDVFIGPGVCFTNDPVPRAKRIRNVSKRFARVRCFASIGAQTTLLPELTVGRYAIVGAGSVVTSDVPDHGLVYGNPARLKGFVSKDGSLLNYEKSMRNRVYLFNPSKKNDRLWIQKTIYERIES